MDSSLYYMLPSCLSYLSCLSCFSCLSSLSPLSHVSHLPSVCIGGAVTFTVRDSYKQRVYLEPLALYLQADVGAFQTVKMDLAAKTVTVTFAAAGDNASFATRRLRVQKLSGARPGGSFKMVQPAGAALVRGAYQFPASSSEAVISWQ